MFDYHVPALKLGADGVQDFFMPVSEAEVDRFYLSFSGKLLAFLRGVGIDNNRTAEAIWLARVYLGLEASGCFLALRIAAGCAAHGTVAMYDGDRGMLTRIARGQEFSSIFAAKLGGRKFESSFTRTWGRYVRSLLRSDDYSRKPPILIDRRKDVLCFSAEPWHRRLAYDEGLGLVVSHPENWYEGFGSELNASSEAVDAAIIEDVVQIAEETARAEGAVLQAHVRASLTSNFTSLIKIVTAMRAAAERHRHHLPEQFWAISMGPLHNRVVARLIQKEGGRITVFDHGSGTGWRDLPGDLPEYASIEWDMCDRFVAFGDRQVGAIERLFEDAGENRIYSRSCEIIGSPVPLYDTSFGGERRVRQAGMALQVWYVPSHYSGEQYYVPPLPPDIVQVDFQARLLRQLCDLGHEVIIKPHPGCKIGMPAELVQRGQAHVDTRPFEAVIAEPDVVILDYPHSTAFRSAIVAGVPMVVLDPGRVPFLPEAMDLLHGSASVLSVTRTAQNRRMVDPVALAEAIAEAPGRTSNAFQRAYFPVA